MAEPGQPGHPPGLHRLLGSSDARKYMQDAIITERDGRYVIPIKADFKGRIPGLVHDVSASGQIGMPPP